MDATPQEQWVRDMYRLWRRQLEDETLIFTLQDKDHQCWTTTVEEYRLDAHHALFGCRVCGRSHTCVPPYDTCPRLSEYRSGDVVCAFSGRGLGAATNAQVVGIYEDDLEAKEKLRNPVARATERMLYRADVVSQTLQQANWSRTRSERNQLNRKAMHIQRRRASFFKAKEQTRFAYKWRAYNQRLQDPREEEEEEPPSRRGRDDDDEDANHDDGEAFEEETGGGDDDDEEDEEEPLEGWRNKEQQETEYGGEDEEGEDGGTNPPQEDGEVSADGEPRIIRDDKSKKSKRGTDGGGDDDDDDDERRTVGSMEDCGSRLHLSAAARAEIRADEEYLETAYLAPVLAHIEQHRHAWSKPPLSRPPAATATEPSKRSKRNESTVAAAAGVHVNEAYLHVPYTTAAFPWPPWKRHLALIPGEKLPHQGWIAQRVQQFLAHYLPRAVREAEEGEEHFPYRPLAHIEYALRIDRVLLLFNWGCAEKHRNQRIDINRFERVEKAVLVILLTLFTHDFYKRDQAGTQLPIWLADPFLKECHTRGLFSRHPLPSTTWHYARQHDGRPPDPSEGKLYLKVLRDLDGVHALHAFIHGS